MLKTTIVLPSIALLTLATGVAVAEPIPAERMVVGAGAMERESWSGPTGGLPVRVVNLFGDVRLRHGGSEGSLEVAAVLQQLAVDGSKLVLDVTATEEAIVVAVVRHDYKGEPLPEASKSDLARADLAVLIPEGAPVRAETAAGLIEARGVRTDVDLVTDNGTIRVAAVKGRVNAHSERGVMEITLEPGVTKGSQRLSSVTGEIVVFTPPTNDLDVTMATSGAFVTDYSLTVEHHDNEEPNKTATATIGKGGASLTMTSRRGDLALRRVVTAP